MTQVVQEVRVQVPTPPAPPPPVNANELGRRIEDAVNQALSQMQDGQRDNARQSIRDAVDEVRAEIAAARAQGGITIQPRGEGVTIQRPWDPENVIPAGAVDISIAFFVSMAFIIVGLPIARAFARRMDRRGETASASEIAPRLDRIEQAVEAIAIEVERVSEGQRYTTKSIAELRGLPVANGGAWAAREAERVPAGESLRRP
ncbi:MAG TPA: hypothetical protein VFD64_18755 [Gemmatimonadaceae bacterium]|nr:hypothetical protein [Gemmatimonadaceae bacterium]